MASAQCADAVRSSVEAGVPDAKESTVDDASNDLAEDVSLTPCRPLPACGKTASLPNTPHRASRVTATEHELDSALAGESPMPRQVQRLLEASLYMKLGKQVVQDEAGDSSDDEVIPTQLPQGSMSASKDVAASGGTSGRHVDVEPLSGKARATTREDGARLRNERAWVEKGASEVSTCLHWSRNLHMHVAITTLKHHRISRAGGPSTRPRQLNV